MDQRKGMNGPKTRDSQTKLLRHTKIQQGTVLLLMLLLLIYIKKKTVYKKFSSINFSQ